MGQKVRKIRNPVAKKIGIDLDEDALYITDDSSEGMLQASVLIEKPTYCALESGGFEILGLGVAWHERLGSTVLRGTMNVVVLPYDRSDTDIMKRKGGPVIISVIRPGR